MGQEKTETPKPQNQTEPKNGAVAEAQRQHDGLRGTDLPRGSEGDTRRASQNRS